MRAVLVGMLRGLNRGPYPSVNYRVAEMSITTPSAIMPKPRTGKNGVSSAPVPNASEGKSTDMTTNPNASISKPKITRIARRARDFTSTASGGPRTPWECLRSSF